MSHIVLKKEPTYFLWKSNFSKTSSHGKATWDWVLKRKYPPYKEGLPAGITLAPIEVYVWDEPEKPANRSLTQEFTPDREGTKSAHKYAKRMVEEQGAILTSVKMRVNFPFEYGKTVESTNYELVRT